MGWVATEKALSWVSTNLATLIVGTRRRLPPEDPEMCRGLCLLLAALRIQNGLKDEISMLKINSRMQY